jgi:hypothetical protein
LLETVGCRVDCQEALEICVQIIICPIDLPCENIVHATSIVRNLLA